jgi:outer membrane protein
LRDALPAKAAQAKLEAEFGKRERELADQGAKLKAAADKLDKDAPTLSETERNRRQRELVDQDRDLQRKRREFQEDLNQRKNEEVGQRGRARQPRDQADLRPKSTT